MTANADEAYGSLFT